VILVPVIGPEGFAPAVLLLFGGGFELLSLALEFGGGFVLFFPPGVP
jgi:hypothetical protein